MSIDVSNLQTVIAKLRSELLNRRNVDGYWQGHLSSSALSTAAAVFALSLADRDKYRKLIESGSDWLIENVNSDGGWGDTTANRSNISATILAWTTLHEVNPSKYESAIIAAERWLERHADDLSGDSLTKAIESRYGKDKTFSCPILTMAALGRVLGKDERMWKNVRPLPFELACLPQSWFRWLGLPVVSYALPALIAMGQVNFKKQRPSNILIRLIRRFSCQRTLNVLEKIQPDSGGFLEAIPLTSFVVMSLTAMGLTSHTVVRKGLQFLECTARADGSWPIDTNLSIWLTSLAVNALAAAGPGHNILNDNEKIQIKQWLLSNQHTHRHPYTYAEPGGWAWTNLPGGVPDADDTAGVLLALRSIAKPDSFVIQAVTKGLNWLTGIQNADGGIPTFCRGWAKLPFDRSAPDLTAHTIAAMNAWYPLLDSRMKKSIAKAACSAVSFLETSQLPDGGWVPLWFGNEATSNGKNPLYGTARVLTHISGTSPQIILFSNDTIERAAQWLLSSQHESGGWAGDRNIQPSVEETALAVDALAALLISRRLPELNVPRESIINALAKGLGWLLPRLDNPKEVNASPIGLYFAELWYSEELYPLIFSLDALQKVLSIHS